MSTDVYKQQQQTQSCGGGGSGSGGNRDVDEDSQMGRLECFETLSSGTDSNATADERAKLPSYSLSFSSSADGVESRSPSGHSDSAGQPSHEDGDDTEATKCSPNAPLKRAFPCPGKIPATKTKRPASAAGRKQSSSASTPPGPSVDYTGISEHADSSCYDFDPFHVHNFAESFKSQPAFPTPNCFSPECTTPSLQNSNSYESPEAPDLDDLEFDSNKGKVTLWQFLLQLLLDHRYAELIRWTNNAGEFVLLRAEEVARLWGLRKDNNHRMNYDKLSRALRYYYQKNIIRKVHGHKFVYRFIGLNNLKGFAFPTAHLASEQSKENNVMQLGDRFPPPPPPPPEVNKSSTTKKTPKTHRNSTTSLEFPGNSQSKSYDNFSRGLLPGLGAASANLYFSPPPPSMAENTVAGGSFLGAGLRFPEAVSRYPTSTMFPPVPPVPSVPSVSAVRDTATANSSPLESLHKLSRPLGLPLPDYPPIPFHWGFPPGDYKKVADSPVSNSLLPVSTASSTSNPMTGSQNDIERFLACFQAFSERSQAAGTANQAIQGMEMAQERANPKKEIMGNINQADRLNTITSIACSEVLQNILQRNSPFHQYHGQAKPSAPFPNPPPTARASTPSATTSGSFNGRSPTPNCKCSCHLAPTPAMCKTEAEIGAVGGGGGPLHSTPKALTPAGIEKTKGWNEIVADLTKEWVNQLRPASSTQDPASQSDPDRLSDLHYQRHLINMNRLREQIDLLASEERKQTASRLAAAAVNPRTPTEKSNNLPAADWNLSAYAPLLNHSMEFLSGNLPNALPLPRATESVSTEQRTDEGYVWMPVQVGLIGKWLAMLSGQMRNDLRGSEARREGLVAANHNDLSQTPSTVGHVNPHRQREFNCSLSGF